MAKGKDRAHGILPISLFTPLKSYDKLDSLEQLQTLLAIPKNLKALMTNSPELYLLKNNHVHVLWVLRDHEHFPSPSILMTVHFEAKTNLYFVLCVYKMVTIFLGDGKWSLDWLHLAHKFCNCVILALVHIEVDWWTVEFIIAFRNYKNDRLGHLNYQNDLAQAP